MRYRSSRSGHSPRGSGFRNGAGRPPAARRDSGAAPQITYRSELSPVGAPGALSTAARIVGTAEMLTGRTSRPSARTPRRRSAPTSRSRTQVANELEIEPEIRWRYANRFAQIPDMRTPSSPEGGMNRSERSQLGSSRGHQTLEASGSSSTSACPCRSAWQSGPAEVRGGGPMVCRGSSGAIVGRLEPAGPGWPAPAGSTA